MNIHKLIKNKYNRQFTSFEWMSKQNRGVILVDDDFSIYSPNTKEILQKLQNLYDDYERIFNETPMIGFFTVKYQIEILAFALKNNQEINAKELLPS